MSGLDVDTRSDVYSLGVMLYELLTGTTPFESDTLKKAGLDEMRRLIREEEPPMPSWRLSTLSAQVCSTVSERRGVDGRRLGQVLRGELDWIVMKALEKDRNRRYESASAFAADVQRYLNDEAVLACPPSAGYRLRKYVRRNRRVLAMVGVVAGSLITATAVSIWQAARATEAQHQAEADRKQAEEDRDRARTAEGTAKTNLERAKEAERRATTEAAIARAVKDFLQRDLLGTVGSAPQYGDERNRNPNLTVREALDRASAKVAERFPNQPLVEAAVRIAIGEAYGSLEDKRLRAKHLERALALRKTHLGPDNPQTLGVVDLLAESYTAIGRYSDAIAMREQLLESTQSKHGPNSPETLERMAQLAIAIRRAGDWRKAMRLMEQVVEKEQALGDPMAPSALGHAQVLAMLYMDAGNYQEAAARLEKVNALQRTLNGQDNEGVMRNCAVVYQRAGNIDEADRILRDLLERSRKKGGLSAQGDHFRNLELLSVNLLLQNRLAEAEPLAREGLAVREKIQSTEFEWRGPHLNNVLGGILLGQKKYTEAEPLLVQGYEGMKRGESTMTGQWRFRLTEAGERVVRYYEETHQPEKARAWRTRLLEDTSKK
jgi:tetratricopeptide (TPR) repeat protein